MKFTNFLMTYFLKYLILDLKKTSLKFKVGKTILRSFLIIKYIVGIDKTVNKLII